MQIEWDRVTWYSKLLAVIVFLVTAGLFFQLGSIYGSATNSISDSGATILLPVKLTTHPSIPTARPPLSADKIYWSDAVNLINRCEVALIDQVVGCGDNARMILKNQQTLQIVDTPSPEVIDQAISKASSTCGRPAHRVGIAECAP